MTSQPYPDRFTWTWDDVEIEYEPPEEEQVT